MKNTNRQPSSGSVLLGMAAGAALGAVGTMAMAQNQRLSSAPHASWPRARNAP